MEKSVSEHQIADDVYLIMKVRDFTRGVKYSEVWDSTNGPIGKIDSKQYKRTTPIPMTRNRTEGVSSVDIINSRAQKKLDQLFIDEKLCRMGIGLSPELILSCEPEDSMNKFAEKAKPKKASANRVKAWPIVKSALPEKGIKRRLPEYQNPDLVFESKRHPNVISIRQQVLTRVFDVIAAEEVPDYVDLVKLVNDQDLGRN